MAHDVLESLSEPEHSLGADFTRRLEANLSDADQQRHRRKVQQRVRRLALILLLAAPILAWHLTLAAPGSVDVVVNGLAWTAFLLDVGVHIDAALLTYLGLQALPTVVGALLLLLVAAGVLLGPGRRQ